MYKKHKIAVSVPAYNEEKLIKKTLENMPSFIDLIIVVDDKSQDRTVEIVKIIKKKDKRIHLITSTKNEGVGKTILKAHAYAAEKNAEIVAVMAGDNQMDPLYLPFLLDAIIYKNYDYVKGNRFFHRQDLKQMPLFRILGNISLTFVTKFCTGYWTISDPLNGYTALRIKTFKKIDQNQIGYGYAFETSLFIELAMIDAKIKDVFIPARYGEEKSKVNLLIDPWIVLQTLLKGFLRRMFYKYTLYNFHPIALFYGAGSLLILVGFFFGCVIAYFSFFHHQIATVATVMLFVVPFILGMQLVLQAIALDIQNEPTI